MSSSPRRPHIGWLPEIPGLTNIELLTVGGYATIYRARQEALGRLVAVKVESFTLESERDQARFVREAHAAGKMSSHPHVVDFFDAGVTADNHPYLVMELCAGSYQDRMPMRPAEVRDIGVKIADALADAHDRNVMHRDVKPANILITHFGEPALADFGLAIITEVRNDPYYSLEVMTPAYAPPEAFKRQRPTPAGDVYGLCATLYALLDGRPPRWQGQQAPPTVMSLVELFKLPIPAIKGVPDALVEILRKGMVNDPAKRPSANRLVEMLKAVRLDPDQRSRPDNRMPRPDNTPTVPVRPAKGIGDFLRNLFRN